VSYVPALKGEAFDRVPSICDMARYVYSTQNLPNTFVRDGDWKLFRFWHDNPEDLTHRYELYNLKDDIGEDVNLAAEYPEKLKELADRLDAFYEESGVLSYHPNQAYNHRTVGTWFATSDQGTIAAKEGTLVLESEKAGYTVANNYFSPDGKNMIIAFEARSATETPIRFAGPKKGKVVELSKEWKRVELSTPQIFIQRYKFRVSLEKAGVVELRKVKVLTTDRTEMTEFKFY